MKLDDAETWYLNFETGLPNEAGGTHIGMFLGWAIRRGLANAELAAVAPALEAGTTSGRAVLFERCDGKLMASDLGEAAAAFATAWYDQHYCAAYRDALGLDESVPDGFALADDTPGNQRLVDVVLDQAFAQWQAAAALPSRQQLHARVTAALAPVAAAAGFTPPASTQWSADAETAEFVRRGEGFQQIVRLRSFDDALPEGRGLGIDVDLEVHLKGLGAVVYAEGRTDVPHLTSAAFATARIAHAKFAAGWTGPQVETNRWQGFRVACVDDIEPLLAWLGARLADFALPVLRRIEDAASLAAAFDAVPLSRSPVFAGYFDYALPLAFEVARHPRLDDVLAEIERNIPTQLDPGHPLRVGMKALIGRIRAREATRRAAEAKARRGFFGRLFDRD
jgi:hypothetical protein